MKQALVTGGAHPIGIGLASAKALVRLGYEVIVTGINDAEIALTPTLDGISARVLDVTNQAAVDALVGSMGRLDALVNCAGRVAYEGFEMDEFLKTVEVNLSGTMRMSIAVHPLLAKQGGAIVNIASVLGLRVTKQVPAYVAAKAGLIKLTEALALEFAPLSIRVNALAPGYVETDLNRDFLRSPAGETMVRRVPMRRFGRPDDLDGALLLLASDAGRYITGATLVVDGGHTLAWL